MLVNLTPFPAELSAICDKGGRHHQVIVLSATWEAPPGAPPAPAPVQPPPVPADTWWGAPGRSSVREEADTAPAKRRVDVIVNGRVHVPDGRPVERLAVLLAVGDIRKCLLVTGDRRGDGSGRATCRPKPFLVMPLVWERAAGGTASTETPGGIDPRNPVGVGHSGARSSDPAVLTEVPNIEYADGRREPAGFGIIARAWQPRLAFAGTYDAAWLETRFPLLPNDFDPDHFQVAPADQQSGTICGGEVVELRHMTPGGLWRFMLPRLDVPVRLCYVDRSEISALRLDTVVLEPEAHRVTLKARLAVPIDRGRAPLQEVILGEVPRGWWRARVSGKRYLGKFDITRLAGT